MPTTINNTQSYASVPTILRKGAQWFADLGPKNSGGTVIFSVSGHVSKPGNFEVPLGIPFADLLALAGGIWKGRQIKAVIPGGSSVPVVPGEIMLKTNMDYDSLKAAGSSIGSAAVIVMDETTCMVRTLERLARFYMSESCGQCTPCREGTGWLDRTLKRILGGAGPARGAGPAARRGQSHRGSHHLRARRRGGMAGAEFPQALPSRVRIHDRSRRTQHRRRRAARLHERGARQYRGQRRADEGAQGREHHSRDRSRRCVCAAILLSRQAADGGQLPHVPGGGREGAEAVAGLRHAGRRGHEDLHPLASRRSARSARSWNSC